MQRLCNVFIISIATASTACVDGSTDLAPERTAPGNAAREAAAAAACPTFAGTWQASEAAFATEIAPVTQVDFSRRGNGAQPTASLTVPRDEYLASGILLDYIGQAGGRLIWAGNPESGFSVKGKCPSHDGECVIDFGGVRITFVSPTPAAGVIFSGHTSAAIFDTQNTQIAALNPGGSGHVFIGYESAVPIDHVEYRDLFGENLTRLVYRRCL